MIYNDLHNSPHELALHTFDPKFCVSPKKEKINSIEPIKSVRQVVVIDIPKPISLAERIRGIVSRVEKASVKTEVKTEVKSKKVKTQELQITKLKSEKREEKYKLFLEEKHRKILERQGKLASAPFEIISAINYVNKECREVIFRFNNVLYKSINGVLPDSISVEDKNNLNNLFLTINYINI